MIAKADEVERANFELVEGKLGEDEIHAPSENYASGAYPGDEFGSAVGGQWAGQVIHPFRREAFAVGENAAVSRGLRSTRFLRYGRPASNRLRLR